MIIGLFVIDAVILIALILKLNHYFNMADSCTIDNPYLREAATDVFILLMAFIGMSAASLILIKFGV